MFEVARCSCGPQLALKTYSLLCPISSLRMIIQTRTQIICCTIKSMLIQYSQDPSRNRNFNKRLKRSASFNTGGNSCEPSLRAFFRGRAPDRTLQRPLESNNKKSDGLPGSPIEPSHPPFFWFPWAPCQSTTACSIRVWVRHLRINPMGLNSWECIPKKSVAYLQTSGGRGRC